MNLKTALSLGLLIFFSSTLVVLMFRAIDHQRNDALENALVQIADELKALRTSSNIGNSNIGNSNIGNANIGNANIGNANIGNGCSQDGTNLSSDVFGFVSDEQYSLTVCYFFSNTRCITCESIENQSRNVVESVFSNELQKQKIRWKTLNYEEKKNENLARMFEIQMPVVVLMLEKGETLIEWKRLDDVWGNVSKPDLFSAYLQQEIRAFLDKFPVKNNSLKNSENELKKTENELKNDKTESVDSENLLKQTENSKEIDNEFSDIPLDDDLNLNID